MRCVLSDKTGTLTRNVMAFVACSVNGRAQERRRRKRRERRTRGVRTNASLKEASDASEASDEEGGVSRLRVVISDDAAAAAKGHQERIGSRIRTTRRLRRAPPKRSRWRLRSRRRLRRTRCSFVRSGARSPRATPPSPRSSSTSPRVTPSPLARSARRLFGRGVRREKRLLGVAPHAAAPVRRAAPRGEPRRGGARRRRGASRAAARVQRRGTGGRRDAPGGRVDEPLRTGDERRTRSREPARPLI